MSLQIKGWDAYRQIHVRYNNVNYVMNKQIAYCN